MNFVTAEVKHLPCLDGVGGGGGGHKSQCSLIVLTSVICYMLKVLPNFTIVARNFEILKLQLNLPS